MTTNHTPDADAMIARLKERWPADDAMAIVSEAEKVAEASGFSELTEEMVMAAETDYARTTHKSGM